MKDENKNILISVIVPVYNAERYLRKSLESLQNQTHENLEIILIDDGSTDKSLQICNDIKKNDDRIKIFYQTNKGVGAARNVGLMNSTGDYIGFMDNDDSIELDMYETLLKVSLETNADITKILVNDVNDSGDVIKTPIRQKNYVEFINSKEYVKEMLLQEGDSTFWSKLFKREIFDEKKFIENRWNEDFIFFLNILTDVDGVYSINKIGYHYWIRDNSFSHSGFNQGIIDNVVNAKWALENHSILYPDLLEYYERLYFYQTSILYILIPINLQIKENEIYFESIKAIKKNRLNIIRNKYLRRKDKILLVIASFMPLLLKRLLIILNYKKMFR